MKKQDFKIICPFCSAEWSAEMVEDLEVSGGCDTCGDVDISGTIDIKCSNCKRVIYRKEILNNVMAPFSL